MYTFCIAEDEYYVQKSIAGRIAALDLGLEYAGCAFTGDDAEDLYDRVHPDLFFVDINMPRTDGISFIERIREKDRDSRTLFIIISGYSDYQNMHRAIRVDVFDYLQKPIVPDEFSEMMRRALQALDQGLFREETGRNLFSAADAGAGIHAGTGRNGTGDAGNDPSEMTADPDDRRAAPVLPQHDDRMEQVCQYIQRHYSEDISARSLGETFYLSSSHISHMFKKYAGVSLGRYLEDVRLSQAEKLLKNTDLLVTEVAERVGYRDGNYFTKCFRKKFKVSPTEIRKTL